MFRILQTEDPNAMFGTIPPMWTYKEVYSDTFGGVQEDEAFCEWLFNTFQADRLVFPFLKKKGYKGTSMKVGDIVDIEGRMYFCASSGWVRMGEA